MAITEGVPATKAVASLPISHTAVLQKEHSNPFAYAKDVAAAASVDQGPFALAEVQETALAVRTPSQQQVVRKVSFSKKLFSCACVRPAVEGDSLDVEFDMAYQQSLATSSTSSALSDAQRKKGVHWDISPRKGLMKQASVAYTDVDWFDARSEFSTMLGGAMSDQAAKLEELSLMIRDLPPAAPTMAPWIPEPPLAFGQPGMTFMPVPAFTGFAAYWERNHDRSTPHPTPIDKMTKASMLAQKSHQSIPGIWLQETDTHFTVTVKPGFMPPGLPRYTERYDKSSVTECSWNMRRDLRLGTTSGQIYMTTDGMLILRARSRPMFGNVDYVMEEYMKLEDGGETIVDRMCCMEVKSGNKASQYVVGKRHTVPLPGHV